MPNSENAMEGKMVMPGDELACLEEFEPGAYTYEDDGKVRASAVGWAHLDMGQRMASVDPINPLVRVSAGDTVICRITDLKKALALAEIVKIIGKERGISNMTDGVIHVSKVAPRFVDNLDNEFRIRDIVRAKVVSTDPNIQLSTQDDRLGVIYAICDSCAKRLEPRNGKLYCSDCDRSYIRKNARDYGAWTEEPEA